MRGPAAATAAPAAPPASRRRLIPAALFIVVLAVHAASPNAMVADSLTTIPVAESIVHRRTLSLDYYRAHPWSPPIPQSAAAGVSFAHGHVEPWFPWGDALLAVPFVAAVDGLHRLGVGPGVEARVHAVGNDWEFEVGVMSVVVALTAVVVYATALAAMPELEPRHRRRTAVAAALVFAFATSAWSTASRSYWSHGPTMLFLALAALLAVRSRSSPRLAGLLGVPLALAYVMRPTALAPLVLVAVWVLLRHPRHIGWFAAGAGLVLAPFFLVDHATWGTLLPPYYTENRSGPASAFAEALAANLVSPARGLLIFSPVLALAVPGLVLRRRQGRLDSLDVTLATACVVHLIAVSGFDYPYWWAGFSFGPRLLTDIVPFLVLLSLPVIAWVVRGGGRRTAAGVAALAGCGLLTGASLVFNAEGALLASTHCWNKLPRFVDAQRIWDWKDAQVVSGLRRVISGPDRLRELTPGGPETVGCPVAADSPDGMWDAPTPAGATA